MTVVALTGASGFIGSHVAEALLRAANTELAELRATVSRLQAELGRNKRGRVELL